MDGDGTNWVLEPRRVIKKANLLVTAKFIWLLVHQCLSPIAADNINTRDREALVAAFVAGFDMYIPGLLLASIYERVFMATTTYHFPCLIFELCGSATLPV